MTREDLEENPIASYYFLENANSELGIRAKKPPVAIVLRMITCKETAQKKQNMITVVRNSKIKRQLAKKQTMKPK